MNPHRQPDQSVRLSNFCLIAPRAPFERRARFVYGNFSNDAALQGQSTRPALNL